MVRARDAPPFRDALVLVNQVIAIRIAQPGNLRALRREQRPVVPEQSDRLVQPGGNPLEPDGGGVRGLRLRMPEQPYFAFPHHDRNPPVGQLRDPAHFEFHPLGNRVGLDGVRRRCSVRQRTRTLRCKQDGNECAPSSKRNPLFDTDRPA